MDGVSLSIPKCPFLQLGSDRRGVFLSVWKVYLRRDGFGWVVGSVGR